MCLHKWLVTLFLSGFLFTACAPAQPIVVTVMVPQLVRETQFIPVEVTRVVTVPQQVTVEVTRVVRETVVATPQPGQELAVIQRGISFQAPRAHHTTTFLPNGKVLVVGGSFAPDQFMAMSELFDPVLRTITWAAPLYTARHDHTATLLPDGRVLVVGGYSLPRQWLNDAEVYSPASDTWTVTPPIYSHGVGHTATLMKDGRVLVVGGCIGSGICTDRVEIFDAATNSWLETMPLPSDRSSHSAQLLPDGRVLVIGGGGTASGFPRGGDALLYDPQNKTWTATSPMVLPRIFAQSAALPDGRILVAGGFPLGERLPGPASASAEIYDPASNSWKAAASLSQPRFGHVLVALSDGRVLAMSGAREGQSQRDENAFVREVESYDPAADQWRVVGVIPLPEIAASAILLPCGSVWITGGQFDAISRQDTWLINAPCSP